MVVSFVPRTEQERVLLLFFAICVAGKQAASVERKVNGMFENIQHPMACLHTWIQAGTLEAHLREYKLGKYKVLGRSVRELVRRLISGLDLETCTAPELLSIPGIGPKTANFFMMYSRPKHDGAALDVHVLRWLGRRIARAVPKQTPQDPRVYQELEQEFLKQAVLFGMTPAELDEHIWKSERDRRPMARWGEIFGTPGDDPEIWLSLERTCRWVFSETGHDIAFVETESGKRVPADTEVLEHETLTLLVDQLEEMHNKVGVALRRARHLSRR